MVGNQNGSSSANPATVLPNVSSITPLDDIPPKLAAELGLLGRAPAYSCLSDPRFSYHLYVPRNYYSIPQSTRPRLVVLMHSTSRDPEQLRLQFKPFATANDVFLLCPLFPVGFLDPADTENYKMIEYRGVRYDRVLLAMVDEVSARFRKLDADRFCLYGFSGGGQFVHRFAYLHPRRLRALVCASPGMQTRWDETLDFPNGVRDLHVVFAKDAADVADDWDSLKRVPALFMCGTKDTDTSYLQTRGLPIEEHLKGGRFGATRGLELSWRMTGADSRFLAVEGAAHQEGKMIQHAAAFFENVLQTTKKGHAKL